MPPRPKLRTKSKAVRRAAASLTESQKKEVNTIAVKAQRRQAEVKFHNWNDFGTVGADGLECQQVSNIAVGTSDSTRVGDRIKPVGLDVNLWTEVGASLGVTYAGTLRLLVIRCTETRTVVPTFDEVFNGAYNGGIWAGSAPRNMDKKSKFQILLDKQFNVGHGSKSSQFNKFTIRKGLVDCQYVAGSTTTGSQQLYFMLVSSNNSVNEHTYRINGQLRYLDF